MIEKIYFPSFLFGWSGKVEEWKKWVKKEELCPRKKKLKKGKKTKQNLYHSQKRISEKTTRFMQEEKKKVKKLPPKRERERERENEKATKSIKDLGFNHRLHQKSISVII